jgi:hypothetical protein
MKGKINEMTSHTAAVVGHDPEANVTVEELLERQLELSLNRAEGGDPSFAQWGKDAPFVRWDK